MACALLEDEWVLGEELEAVTIEGETGSQLGAAVAVGALVSGEPMVVLGAPGTGVVVVVDGEGVELSRMSGAVDLGRRVWVDDGQAMAWMPGVGVLDMDGGVVHAAPQAVAIARCPDGSWWSSQPLGDALDCAEGGLIRSTCSETRCAVSLESIPGEAGISLGDTSAGSAVGWIDGEACWGDATLLDDPTPGALRCMGGVDLDGLDGDHLGASIGADRVAGVFNKWQVPARIRILSPGGGMGWSIDRASERSRVALAASDELVVVGVPGFLTDGAGDGRVYLVTP